MENNEQLVFLKSKIDDRIKGINGRRLHYRRKAFFSFFCTALLATISAILLGLNISGWEECIRIAVLILSSLISLFNIFNAFFNYKDLWIANNTALNKFYELKYNIEFLEKGIEKIDNTAITSFKNQYQEILNEANQSWLKSRSDSHQ